MARTNDTPNVSDTPLSQHGVSLQPGLLTAKRGQCSYKSSLERAHDQAGLLINLQQLIPGIWTSKGIGWTRERAGAFNAGAPFLDMSFFLTTAGAKSLVWQVGDDVQNYDLSTHTETAVTGLTGLSTSAYPTMRRSFSFITGISVLVYCNGDIEPRKMVTPTTTAALNFITVAAPAGVWPGLFNGKTYTKPKFCEPFGPAMVYGGFSTDTTVFDILISDRTNIEQFITSSPVADTDAVAFTYPPELGQLVSIRSHQISNQSSDEVLICGCTNGIFVITGNSASTYSLKILTREIGVLSNRCWVQVGDDLIFLSTSGFRSYSSVVNNAVLIPDQLSRDIQDFVNQIDKDNAYKAHAFHNLATQEIQFWVPLLLVDGGEARHGFILNYNNEASGNQAIMPVWSIKQGTGLGCSIVFGGVCYGGGQDGLLQIHYSGDTYDGAPISFFLRLSVMSLGNPSQKCSIRNIDIVTEGGRQKFTIAVYRISKQAGGAYKRALAAPGRKVLQVPDLPGTALGSWVLGSGAFPSDHLKVISFQPQGNGTFWEVELSSTASDDALDYCCTNYTLSGGSIQR